MAQLENLPIAEIKLATPRTSQISVRVMRLWYRRSEREPDTVQGVELILIDANGDTIQASVNKRLTRLFLEHLTEGRTYIIKRFSISSNRVGLDMATFHACKIWFEYSTRVIPITNDDIPFADYTFCTFNEVFMGAMPDRLYIDVIGRLEHVYPIKETNGKRRRTVILRNEENQLLCCSMFGEYVDQIGKIEADFSIQNRPTLVMCFVKRSVYEGEVSITTTWGATKILVNPNIPRVNEFNDNFPNDDDNDDGAPGIAAYHPPILASANIKTLSEIEKLTKGGAYVTLAKFLELDTATNSWFYNSCKECRSKVKQGEDGLWYCEKVKDDIPCKMKGIGTTVPIPRFQVKFYVTYESGDLLHFIIWDEVMSELLGKSAQAILEEDEIYNLVPPPHFRPLLEKTFVAKIRVTQQFNIDQNSNSYGVISLCVDPRTITKWQAMNDARKEQAMSSSTMDTAKTDSLMEQMREIHEDEPVMNAEEITPQKSVLQVPEASDKSSATKLQEIALGKQLLAPSLKYKLSPLDRDVGCISCKET